MAGNHQSFTFEAFWVVSRYNSVLHVQKCIWGDLICWTLLCFPLENDIIGLFCPSFLGNMCSVSQAETASGFAVCVEKSLWLNSDSALHKLPCKGPMAGIALLLHPEWFQVPGILCWVLLPFDRPVCTALCWVSCRNMGEHLGGVSFDHMEVEDKLLLIISVWKQHMQLYLQTLFACLTAKLG